MNTYRAIQNEAGGWTVEWSRNGIVQDLLWGTTGTEAEALYAAWNLTRMEWAETPRV